MMRSLEDVMQMLGELIQEDFGNTDWNKRTGLFQFTLPNGEEYEFTVRRVKDTNV